MTSMAKPLPASDPATSEYWEGAKMGQLRLPKCMDCGKFHFYPRTLCPHCGSVKLEWQSCSGRGVIYSYTAVHRAPSPAFEADVPYVVAVIALEEGPHLMSSIINTPIEKVHVGENVRVTFSSAGSGDEKLPMFEIF